MKGKSESGQCSKSVVKKGKEKEVHKPPKGRGKDVKHLDKKMVDKAAAAECIVMSNKKRGRPPLVGQSHRPREAQKILCLMDAETSDSTHLVVQTWLEQGCSKA